MASLREGLRGRESPIERTNFFPFTVHRTGVPPDRDLLVGCPVVGGRRKDAFPAVGVWGKGWLTTYDLPGVYINTRIKHASPPNLFLSFLHFSRWDSSMYMSLYTFLQSWEPTNRTSCFLGVVCTQRVCCLPHKTLGTHSHTVRGSFRCL